MKAMTAPLPPPPRRLSCGADHLMPAPSLETPRQRYGYLPANLMTVLETVGEDTMLRLVAACGGTRLHLGRPPREGGRLAAAVGMDAAWAIYRRFVADSIIAIDVPMMSALLARHRIQRILAMRAAGLTVAEVARQLGMTERGVYAACARARQDAESGIRHLPRLP